MSKPPTHSNGAPIYRFMASWPCGPAGCLKLLLIKTGDVETNPGPKKTHRKFWICDICHKQIDCRKQISMRCNRIEHMVHLICAGISASILYRCLDLPSTQRCQTHNSHIHNTTAPFHTLVQASYPLLTYTTATQTHIQHSPCSHRIGKAQKQSSYPLTPLTSYTAPNTYMLLLSSPHPPRVPSQPHRQTKDDNITTQHTSTQTQQ